MIKLLLFLLILFVAFHKLLETEDFFLKHKCYFSANIFSHKGLYLLLAFTLCLLNWYFESLKWHIAANEIEPLSKQKALAAVLEGQAVNLVFPGGIGHMLGRILSLKTINESKINAAGLVLICQASQMLVTFLFSFSGFFFLIKYTSFPPPYFLLLLCFILSGLILLAILFCRKIRWIKNLVNSLNQVSKETAAEIFFYSVLRYLVFMLQYILALRFLGCEIPEFQLAFCISLVFMAKSLMPSFNFMSDLGVREFSALLFLPLLGIKNEIIIGASLYIWVINILLPSLTGAGLILKSKWQFR